MLLIWYLSAVMYHWVPISLVVVKVWAVRCPSDKDSLLLCETIPWLILLWIYPFFSVARSLISWYALSCCYSFWQMLPLPGTLFPGLFWHLHLCHGLSLDLSIIFVSFKLAFLFFKVSSLATKIKPLRGNAGIHLPTLCSEKFSRCVSCRLTEVGAHEVQISIFIYHRLNGCQSTS